MNGKNVRSGGQRRKGGWEGQRAVGLLHDIANVVGILPAMSRPPLHEKRPCSNRVRKKQKKLQKKYEKRKFEHSAHWFVTTNVATPDRNGTFTGPEGHRCSSLSYTQLVTETSAIVVDRSVIDDLIALVETNVAVSAANVDI